MLRKAAVSITAINVGSEPARAPGPRPQVCPAPAEIVVPFTTPQATQTALDEAVPLALRFNAALRLIAVHFVPFPLALQCPRVSIGFLTKALQDLHCVYPAARELYLTREPDQMWAQVLAPQSLIVIGPSNWLARWHAWKFARSLQKRGHRVRVAASHPAR